MIFCFTVLPEGTSPEGGKRQRRAVQPSIPGEDQHEEDEENGEGVRRPPEKGTGRNGRTEGKLAARSTQKIQQTLTIFAFQRLRNENRLLKKRNELLEAESAELADRLVRGQVSRAEEEETSYAIQSELLALRRVHLEVAHQLETANEEVRALSLRLQENVSRPLSSDLEDHIICF